MNLSNYHLKKKYRKVLDNLSDEDKIKTTFKKTKNINVINEVLTYYELKNNPLHKELALNKIKDPLKPYWAFCYAEYVIKGRWFEAEEVIKTNSYWAFCYAEYVIKGRWIEAEEVIKTDPVSAFYYACYTIKDRLPEAEETIKKTLYWPDYKTNFNLQG